MLFRIMKSTNKVTNSTMLIFLMALSFQAFGESSEVTDCDETLSAFNKRLCIEKSISKEPFVLIPYKPNYFIGSYVADIQETNANFDDFEAKFQLSFKIPITRYENPRSCLGIDGTECILFFGYTQLSVWQMLNFDQSAPFRDTNFEPEFMVSQLIKKKSILGWNLRLVNYGLINHQSNGKVPPTSRSWNRSYIDFVFERNNHYITFKAWKRWQEDMKTDPSDFKGDDNENIEDFVGNAELKYFYVGKRYNYSFEIRDSKNNSNHANIQINWSVPFKDFSLFPVDNDLRFYIQYFNGYGETLIDFDKKRERIGFGVMLTDWL